MNVAVIDGDVSYPANSGKRLRTLNLLLHAARRHRVFYVGRCTAGSEEDRRAPSYLRQHGIEPVLVHHPVPRKAGASFYARLLANQFSSLPYSVMSHKSEPMRRAVSELARRERIDVWQVEWAPYLQTIDAAIPGPRVVGAHNVDTVIWRRYYETETHPLKKALLRTQWRRFHRFEDTAFRRATRVVAVTEGDAQQIRERFGQPHVDVVENGIDRAYFESIVGRRNPSRILFLGSLDWRPNLDAIGLLLDEIFPRVRAQQPDAELVVVGRNPTVELTERVRRTRGCEMHADVPDVRPFLGSSGVMAVPLRIGGGSRLKILEAIASGLPVIATSVAAEGLRLQPGLDYVQAEEDRMADALVEAIRAPADMQAMAEHGRRIVLDTYDWAVLAKGLELSWERSVGQAAARQ